MRILCLVLLLMLSGCGFKLGTYQSVVHKYPKMQVPFCKDTKLYQMLLQSLQQAHVKITTEDAPQLSIVGKNFEQKPLVYAIDGELRRERVTLTIDFEFNDGLNRSSFSLSTNRERAIISKQRLAADLELQQIEQQMQKEIMQQLITQLSII